MNSSDRLIGKISVFFLIAFIFVVFGPIAGLGLRSYISFILPSEKTLPFTLHPIVIIFSIAMGFHPASWAGVIFGIVAVSLPEKFRKQIVFFPLFLASVVFTCAGALAGAIGCAIVNLQIYTFGTYALVNSWSPFLERYWRDAQIGILGGAACGLLIMFLARKFYRKQVEKS